MSLETLTRRATIAPATFDPGANTIEVVFTTGATVRRRDWDGDYDEELVVDPKTVRLDRLNAGAPFLNSHSSRDLDDVIGSVVPGSARIDKGRGVATIALSRRADAAGIIQDLRDGVVRNVSVGYQTHRVEKIEADDGSVPVWRVTDWEPFEISAVAIPADAGAQTRNLPRSNEMSEQDTIAPEQQVRRSRVEVERERSSTIASLANKVGLPDFADTHIRSGTSIEKFRVLLIDEMAERQERAGNPTSHARTDLASNSAPGLAEAVQDALVARMTGDQPQGRAQEFASRSLIEMGSALLEARGERVRSLGRSELADRVMGRSGGMMTTSDFPRLLQGAGQRVLAASYEAAGSPLRALARVTDVPDFRRASVLRLSEAPSLDLVNEHGEITRGSRGELEEGVRVATFAKIFALSRQAIINDDLNAFADAATAWGRAAAEREAAELVSIFTANSGAGEMLTDGKALFHASRGNLAASGSAISVEALSDARLSLRTTKGLDGTTPLALTPQYLLVGAELETAAEKVLASLAAATVGDANPFSKRLELLVEPRLAGKSWRVFADPVQAPVLTLAYLRGARGPQLATKEGWDTLGTEYRCTLDVGAAALGWRGGYLNPGQ